MHFFNDRNPPTILDIEASGFGKGSYPIEIGFINGDGDRFCSLIQPLPQWTHWCNKAESAHGISREKLMDAGRPVREVASELNELLTNNTVYSDGWVVDLPWLITFYSAVNIEPSFTLSSIELIMKETQIEFWDDTYRKLLATNNAKRHRASFDAFLIQQTWIETYRLTNQIPPSDRIATSD